MSVGCSYGQRVLKRTYSDGGHGKMTWYASKVGARTREIAECHVYEYSASPLLYNIAKNVNLSSPSPWTGL